MITRFILAVVSLLLISDNPLLHTPRQEPQPIEVGTRFELARKVDGKTAHWASSNPVVLQVSGYIATARAPGTAWLLSRYGSLRDSTLITVVLPPLAAPTNLVAQLSRMDYGNIGLDVTWSAVTGATQYRERAFYTGGAAITQTITVPSAYVKLGRNINQSYSVCVLAADATRSSSETCVTGVAPDIDRVSIYVDSTQLTVGSTMKVCGYGWYQNRVVLDQPVTITSSDTLVAKVALTTDATPCINRLPVASIWPRP